MLVIMLSLLFRSLKKRQKDRKMSLVKEEAKEDSEEAVGLIMKVEKIFLIMTEDQYSISMMLVSS